MRRGFWQLTEAGRKFAAEHPTPFSEDLITELYSDIGPVPRVGMPPPPAPPPGVEDNKKTPEERLEDALAELRQNVGSELLAQLLQVKPQDFEQIVLHLLHSMGYGTSREDIQRVGGVGDGGIDGVISLDRLGLEKVYVQAKRWQGTVGRPEVQAFYGALAGQRANKGVFITTSTFTQQALDFARSVERVVLVDGARLANLMMDNEVGVTLRPVKVPKLDSDYFEE